MKGGLVVNGNVIEEPAPAGVAIATILGAAGVADIVVCDSRGIIDGRRSDRAAHKRHPAAVTNPRGLTGGIAEAMQSAQSAQSDGIARGR